MAEQKLLDIIKQALLLEYRGKALYESVLKTSPAQAVRDLFGELAAEEGNHIAILETQYKAILAGNPGIAIKLDNRGNMPNDAVLTKKLVAEISAAGYEAAVISAAIELENGAIAWYGQQATQAGDQAVRDLFAWLCNWEKSHLEMLAGMDRDLRDKVWSDNQFWPLD